MRYSPSASALKKLQIHQLHEKKTALEALVQRAKEILHLQKVHHERKIPVVDASVEKDLRISYDNMIFDD